MNRKPEFYVDPSAGGRLTAEALLHSEGSVEFLYRAREFPKKKCCIFHIAGDDFWFNFGFVDGELSLQRREFDLRMPEDFFLSLPGNETVIASWTLNRLTLLLGPMGFQGRNCSKWMEIEARPPPASLINWVRRQNLLPMVEYDSEATFVSRVHAGLSSIQGKIDEMASRSIFWDIQYDGARIVSRSPKKERDLLTIIHGLLSDHFFLSSIEIYPELTAGIGRLDFLFVGCVKRQGQSKVCAEFKLAHSRDLEKGIENQLPEYMRRHKTRNGTYCVLDFNSKDNQKSPGLHERLAAAARRGWQDWQFPIKIHHVYFGNQSPPSRLSRE